MLFARTCLRRLAALLLLAFVILLIGLSWLQRQGVAAQSISNLFIVSAASYQPVLAPESISTLFGSELATATESANQQPLPTTLAERQVRVDGRVAQLLVVTPAQINFLLPKDTTPGTATVEVLGTDGRVRARGGVEVRTAAAALFTANANGSGVPAALALRVGAGGQTFEPIANFEQPPFQPLPLRFGPEEEKIFLILFLTGVRGACRTNPCENVKVVTAGQEVVPAFAGPQGDLVGLDQINVELPRQLRGRSKLFISVRGAPASNEVELEYLPFEGQAPPRLESLSAPEIIASEEITITGSGFAATPEGNRVTFGDVTASVSAATPTQLKVHVPFGVRTGPLIVETAQGKAISPQPVRVRTSLSGLVSDASAGTAHAPVPLEGVRVRLFINGQRIETVTGHNGFFVLKNVPPPTTFSLLTFDTSALPQRFASPTLFPTVQTNRDNQVGNVRLQPNVGTGASTQQQGGSLAESGTTARATNVAPGQTQSSITLRSAGVVFEVPAGTQITMPAGENNINLTALGALTERDRPEQSLAPVALPDGVFSSRIVQITPFDAKFSRGGKLTFPNTEELPPNAEIELYHFVQDAANEGQRGKFASLGRVVLSSNGQIETASNAIKEGGYYFVAAKQPPAKTKLLFGRVVERGAGTEKFPVSQAVIQVQGQTDLSDGSGLFTPRQVPVIPGRRLQVTASFRRPNGRFAYVTKLLEWEEILAAGEALNVGELALVDTARPPALIVPETVELNAGEAKDLPFKAYDPEDANRALSFSDSDRLPFADIPRRVTGSLTDYLIRLTPTVAHVGQHRLRLNVSRDGTSLFTFKDITIIVRGVPRSFKLLAAEPSCDAVAPSGPVVRFSWELAQFATRYEIYRREGNGNPLKLGETEATNYTDKCATAGSSFDKCVIAGGSYEYSVLAVNSSGSQAADRALSVQVGNNICDATPVTVALPSLSGAVGTIVTIPIIIGDLSGRTPDALAYEFELSFDPNVLQFEELDKAETLSLDVIEALNREPRGKLRVAAIARQRPFAGATRTLLKLKFRVLAVGTSPLVWQKFILNEGAPASSQQPGRFTAN